MFENPGRSISGPFARSLRCRAFEYNTGIRKPFRLASEQMDSDTASPGIPEHTLGASSPFRHPS